MNIEKTVGWKDLIFEDQVSDCRQNAFGQHSRSVLRPFQVLCKR